MNSGSKRLKQATYNTTFMYNVRMLIAFTGTAFVPYLLDYQLATIPLTLGVVAAAISDIDDRFSVRLMNLIYTYIGFFITAASVQLLFPYPIAFAVGLIASCIGWILLGSLGRRYATIAYGCLVISVYTMLGVHLFEEWYLQPALLVVGAAWYGLLSTISFLLFPVRQLQDQLAASYNALGGFLYAKSNLFDVDMTPSSYQQSMIDLSMENSKLIGLFNNLRVALLTRLKGDRGQKDTRRSLQYYFVAQDIHERADSAHIDYQKLTKVFQHSDILFRFQRILSIQGKACQDLAQSILSRTRYTHNKRFKHSFENLRLSLEKLREDGLYDQVRVNALFALYQNLKSIDAQLQNLETERNLVLDNAQQPEHQLKDDDLKGMKDIVVRIKQNLTPESVLFRHAVRLSIVLFIGYLFIQMTNIAYGYWILLTALFVCQPNFNATKRRLYLRIIGTLVGIIVGLAIIYFIPSLEGQLVMLVLSGILFFELRSKQYAQATAFITILALINFNLDGSAFAAGFPRFIDTIIGCALAWFGVSFIWPDWKFRRLPRSIRRALQAQCQYLAEVVTQYHQGRNNALNYRVVRRAAHNTDAEVASLISTLATEPNIDSTQKAQAFEFLCLSHTFLSYIAALGAHREQIQDQEVLDLLDQALDDIQGALLRDEVPDLSAQNMLQTIRQRLTQKESNENDQKSLIILQQLSLMLSILTRLSMLKQSLGHEPSEDGTEFASL
ncbi:TIGR01666 family membrane protein [Acinetobacter haemolyticus]|uniref:TIGR01666 family membrane protein n=2 Tax=Acinetobacter haemolyticus TaxID=29430 RepID=N9GH78_ACIHA|nr:YccS family putative transporter [Acinetobacter haemolyticus]ENW16474.1 TIGR01666 family membrane protein [Acinetobacter haemolyticus CIP 64.3 = MTCC 9819]EPR89577.1 putative efflux (PET) family inner membrane protein YccS [Acinetobacter haemolyticus CIP 64.3 = MTCC 9819]NAS02368.1 TIGR01666 family membrane protein [Acinetobacter haemolyticus]NAS04331.1 TIGR01666 family membrane protein [Acinetobacter haemolyticus]QHI30412.1 TIGR01666 family membrane protein [Acinetobacter haemolyticus]